MILVATGLQREARSLAGTPLSVIAGGGDRQRLEAELERGAAEADAIISIGLGGALLEGLWPGDWVVASAIVCPDASTIVTDSGWTARLLETLPRARSGTILGSDVMIADKAGKALAHQASGAAVVDMESHIAGGVAARHGLPFAVARVVSDAAGRSLPKAAQAGMAADGRMDIMAVLASLAASPWQLPALIRVGSEAETAFQPYAVGETFLARGWVARISASFRST